MTDRKKILLTICVCVFFALLLASKRYVPVVASFVESVMEIESAEVRLDENLTKAQSDHITEVRLCIVRWMANEVGLVERTNRNDNPRINEYFENIGFTNMKNKKASHKAYCGAFMANAWLSCGVEVKFVSKPSRLASVDGWRQDGASCKINQADAEIGDVVSFALHRHVEGIYEKHPNPNFQFFTSIGGNTSAPEGHHDSREGVHKKTRMWSEIQSVISLNKTMSII